MAISQSSVDLEFHLRTQLAEQFVADLRLTQPDGRTMSELASQVAVQIDTQLLHKARADQQKYGQLLSAMLFADLRLRVAYAQARTIADATSLPLRLRLRLDQQAELLHQLHWETLLDPVGSGEVLALGGRVLLSRYLEVADTRPLPSFDRLPTRALIAVAGPADLENYALAPINVQAESTAALTALRDLKPQLLATQYPSLPLHSATASLEQIAHKLRAGVPLLYLVCHGVLVDGEPYLYLDDAAKAQTRVTAGEDLVQIIRGLPQLPALIVLASCASASTDSGDHARVALGARLAQAGIPAVIAMQGRISMQSVSLFMPALFRELLSHGQIDRALAVARFTIRERHDWWVPTLSMRLRDGQLWPVQPRIPMQASAGQLNYEQGLAALRERLSSYAPQRLAEFATLEDGLRTSLRDERLYGTSNGNRSRAIYGLNTLALEALTLSFNQLCQNDQPD